MSIIPPFIFGDRVERPEQEPPAKNVLRELYQRIMDKMNPRAALVGGLSSTLMRSVLYPIERGSNLCFTGQAKSDAELWNKVKKAPYLGFRPQVLAAVGGAWAYYGVGFAFIDRDKPLLTTSMEAGVITALFEQVSAKQTALYYRTGTATENQSLSPKARADKAAHEYQALSLKARARIQSVILGRHLAANGATFALSLIAQRELEAALPKELCPLAGFGAGCFAVKVTHILYYDRLVALSVMTSINPEQAVWKTWRQLRTGVSEAPSNTSRVAEMMERVKAGGIWRGRGRMGILGGVLAAESIFRNWIAERQ